MPEMPHHLHQTFVSIVTALAISASFITGCSKGDKVDSTMQSSENGGKQILKFGCFDYVDSIDPGNMINAAWNCTRFGVGECLFRFNDAMEAEPCLCDTYGVSSDQKRLQTAMSVCLPAREAPHRKNFLTVLPWLQMMPVAV